MAGDAKNTSLWTGADVYTAPKGTVGPVDLTSVWPVAWKALGLLDGGDGLTEARDQTTNNHYAWGGVLFKKTITEQTRTFAFTALEDNDNVFLLANPGSTSSVTAGVRKRVHMTPKAGFHFALGLETRDGSRIKRRVLPDCEVEEIDDITENEEDPTAYKFTITVYPAADGTLYTTIETDPGYTPSS